MRLSMGLPPVSLPLGSLASVSLASLLLATLFLAACADTTDMSDTEKQQRIVEMYAEYQGAFSAAPGITVDQLLTSLEGPEAPLLVDVRTPEEQAVSMIPGAISQEEYEARRSEFGERSVVTYCTIGYRSGLYAEQLAKDGVDVRNLEGSILSWTHSGQPLENGGVQTRRVHVYGATWNLAADDFDAVW